MISRNFFCFFFYHFSFFPSVSFCAVFHLVCSLLSILLCSLKCFSSFPFIFISFHWAYSRETYVKFLFWFIWNNTLLHTFWWGCFFFRWGVRINDVVLRMYTEWIIVSHVRFFSSSFLSFSVLLKEDFKSDMKAKNRKKRNQKREKWRLDLDLFVWKITILTAWIKPKMRLFLSRYFTKI